MSETTRKSPATAASGEYSTAAVLLPFLARFIEQTTPLRVSQPRLRRDGAMCFPCELNGQSFAAFWMESAPEIALGAVTPPLAALREGVVAGAGVDAAPGAGPWPSPAPGAAFQAAQRGVAMIAGCLNRLLTGTPPDLLRWRNRQPAPVELYWNGQLPARLNPTMLAPGRTRYFDYHFTKLVEREGLLDLEFESREATVVLRLTLGDLVGAKDKPQVVHSWGPVTLLIGYDERSEAQRRQATHQVEDFAAYLLSRNLPPRFSLKFERGDPPASMMPSELDSAFLELNDLGSGAFYEMLMASGDDVALMMSCDRECANLFSYISTPGESGRTKTPWIPVAACYHVFDRFYTTGSLTTAGTILGGNHLERALDGYLERPRDDTIIVHIDSCLSRLVHEDSVTPIEKFRRESAIPLVTCNITSIREPYLKEVQDFWLELYRRVGRPEAPVEPGTAALLAFPPDFQAEQDALLAARGVQVRSRLFPLLDVASARRLASCAAVVINEWDYARHLFASMLDEGLRRPAFALPLPYGLEGTRRFCDGVAQAVFGEVPGGDPGFPASFTRLLERYHELCERVRGARIGIFARARDATRHLLPVGRFGIPLLDFLRELGLGLDVNLLVEEGAPVDEGALRSALSLDASPNDALSFHEHRDQALDRCLRGDFALVYTERFHDERVTWAGKRPLSPTALRPMLSGAVETARYLTGLLAAPFYERYRRFLPHPFARYRDFQQRPDA